MSDHCEKNLSLASYGGFARHPEAATLGFRWTLDTQVIDMQFTKPMIELVYEIRRCCPSELKPAVKLANPELFAELQAYYHNDANVVSKALIKELFALAGNPWDERLAEESAETPKQSVRVYRGQVQVEDKPMASTEPEAKQKARKKRVYRGQVIYE